MPHLQFVTREPITKGWSSDRKFRVTTADGTPYLLRLSDAAQEAEKRLEFEMMQQVAARGVPMCRPVAFGVDAEGVYSVQSWIDGDDAEAFIPTMPPPEQYAYGWQAGAYLQQIHTIPAPEGIEDWEVRFNRKLDGKLQRYRDCPIHYDGGETFIRYMQNNRQLLRGRPQVFQHGDYHIGNMMVGRTDRLLYVIDFNRSDFGDPWEEFNRIVWCAQSAPPFASGLVDGYFDGAPPQAFWQLLALYIAGNTLSSIYWAIPFGDGEVQVMLNQAQDVLRWYDHMRQVVPTWYQPA